MSGPLVFDSTPLEAPVKIDGKDYILREANGDAAGRYRDAILDNTELEDGKAHKLKGISQAEPLLVSLCLFTVEGKPVPLATIKGWPNRIQRKLFDRAKEMSELSEDTDLDSLTKQRDILNKQIIEARKTGGSAKNVPESTTAG